MMTDLEHRQKQRERCEEQGHDYVNCVNIFLRLYKGCKWCGDAKSS